MFNQYCLGVDVSHWQAQVEWPQLYAAGVRFAVVKATQGNYRRDLLLHTHLHGAAAIPAPLLPARCPDWDFWQFSGDKFVLPGCQSPLDLNFFHGDLPALQGWLGRVPLPELTLEEKIQRLWQAHPDLWKQQEVLYESA